MIILSSLNEQAINGRASILAIRQGKGSVNLKQILIGAVVLAMTTVACGTSATPTVLPTNTLTPTSAMNPTVTPPPATVPILAPSQTFNAPSEIGPVLLANGFERTTSLDIICSNLCTIYGDNAYKIQVLSYNDGSKITLLMDFDNSTLATPTNIANLLIKITRGIYPQDLIQWIASQVEAYPNWSSSNTMDGYTINLFTGVGGYSGTIIISNP
jgi:hypothetical protein